MQKIMVNSLVNQSEGIECREIKQKWYYQLIWERGRIYTHKTDLKIWRSRSSDSQGCGQAQYYDLELDSKANIRRGIECSNGKVTKINEKGGVMNR